MAAKHRERPEAGRRGLPTVGATCRFCGMAIAKNLYAMAGEAYCCEGCFLKEKEFRVVQAERDQAYLQMAEALSAALDAREHETGLHSKRVACHTLVLAKRGTSDPDRLHQIYWGALLHDIGKIGVPDAILLKPGPLTEREWVEMQRHPEIGRKILKGIPFLAEAEEIVFCHEERYDGSGYPRGLAKDAIPWGARIFAIIDTLDAMTSRRPYQPALAFDSAKQEILKMSGVQFDPAAVELFLTEETTLREMVALKCGELEIDPARFGKER